ncbi:hypothetical protein [uncultured Cohaesibacter sp.]|uniref:hypothetical protein n=1 Tax=uncultured Cohaesibacter sp. TaxID=1002546 RepID=UPI0029C95E59|nr:hypothetical protein [uncultured Cohaesibacter sp.]
MKHTLTFAALLLLGTSFAAPARAENVIIAECHGNGADFYLSDFDRENIAEAGKSVGLPPPTSADAILVVDRRTGAYHWDSRSRAAIARECGGKEDELALFEGIQPKPGLWQARLGATRLDGCPPIMEQFFPKSPGALPPEWQQPRPLTYQAPFHPDKLEMTKTLEAQGKSKITWRSVGNDAWEAEVFSELFGQIPAGEGLGSKMTWNLKVKSPSEITHISTVHIVLPAEAAAVLGGKDCKMVSANAWVRVGD